MIKCDCCGKEFKILKKDYRFIDGYFSGKCFMCDTCIGLNDVDVYKIVSKKKLK